MKQVFLRVPVGALDLLDAAAAQRREPRTVLMRRYLAIGIAAELRRATPEKDRAGVEDEVFRVFGFTPSGGGGWEWRQRRWDQPSS